MVEVGQVVFSKCGRDKTRAFIIVSVENEYVFLADGDLRKLIKPKKKKIKHIQITNNVTSVKFDKDSDVRKILSVYNSKREVNNLG